jgi:hypothetical protein
LSYWPVVGAFGKPAFPERSTGSHQERFSL